MIVVASIPPLLADIGVSILVAATLAFLARGVKQPLILAYVLAGVLLGDKIGFSLVTSIESVEAISSLGLILLLFLIGLEIDVPALRRSGKAVVLAGLLQVPINAALFVGLPILLESLELTPPLGRYGVLYVAFALSLSSTLVVVKLLHDKFEIDTSAGRLTLGILVLQDFWAILFLAVQPSLASPEFGPLLLSLGYGVGLVVGSFLAARYALPIIFRGAARAPELIVLGALAWCFLIAGLASRARLSAEMGALVAGLSLSVLPYRADVIAKVTTVRDFFLTLFFVSLGLAIPEPTASTVAVAVGVAVIVFVSRFVVLVPLIRKLGPGDRAALNVSVNLGPVSEFSLVLTAIGLNFGHVTPAVLELVVYVMVVTAVAGTYAMLGSESIIRAGLGLLTRLGWAGREGPAPDADKLHHPRSIALLGFHRTASALVESWARTAPDRLTQVLVVDFNPVVLTELEKRGIACAYGDLASPDTLLHTGLEGAEVVVCSIPDSLFRGTNNRRLLAQLRTLCPDARVIVTAESRAVEEVLRREGAAAVHVAARGAADSLRADVEALLEGRPAPSEADASAPRDEVLR